MIFVVDQSASLAGTSWSTITSSLDTFFNDPASANVGAGLLFFPYAPYDCDVAHYEVLTAPLDELPKNASALTSAIPATADGIFTPVRPALHGALLQATAWQDANPTHRTVVVLTTTGAPQPIPGASDTTECGDPSPFTVWDKLSELASAALSYNGVRTFVVGVPGATITNLDEIAKAGGTTAAFDATDISKLGSAIGQIRTAGLGCDYAIPAPPNNPPIDFNKVNFSYTPSSTGQPTTLPRAKDLVGCNGQPGWYYDDDSHPTEIVLCPASCSVIEADNQGTENVLFGCDSVTN
jgi:hypothetical protein